MLLPIVILLISINIKLMQWLRRTTKKKKANNLPNNWIRPVQHIAPIIIITVVMDIKRYTGSFTVLQGNCIYIHTYIYTIYM